MTRLYLRIFLSFWVVIILTVCAVLLINTQLELAQQDDIELSGRAMRAADGMSQRAQRALDRGGPEALARWAEGSPQRGRRITVFIIDADGRDLLNRSLPREVRHLNRQWQRDGQTPEPLRRGQFIAELQHEQHGRYLAILTPPPRPMVLRLFAPLGTVGLIGLAIVISGLVCLWLARSITRPVQQIRTAGRALGRGQLDARVAESASNRSDELGDLARDFNGMAERLESLIQSQRQLLRDVSHELRSPLARLQVALALAAGSEDSKRREDYLSRMETDIGRLNHLIGEILGYARLTQLPEIRRDSFDLAEMLDDVAASARLEGQTRNIRIQLDDSTPLPLSGDAELLQRAIENVVRNALAHSPQDGTIMIDVQPDTDRVSIAVRDQGPGVPEERLDNIFQPFVRLNDERGVDTAGGGIGLAIAQAAIELHGGSIRAQNHVDGGLEVLIDLPRNTS